jgi:hypothetical protein
METVTESARANIDTFLAALCDPNIDRVVVIAHSQGTIVAAVLLKALQEALQGRPGVRSGPGAQRVSLERRIARKLMGTAPYAVPHAPIAASRAKRQLTPRDVGKLELYCFANCATSMEPFVALGASPHHAPWIESYGNEHDLVAKLGLLAPPHGVGSSRIEGDRYRRNGAWGHLLNAHYLNPMMNDLDGATSGGEKLVPFDSNLRKVPRLFEYARGSSPGAYP